MWIQLQVNSPTFIVATSPVHACFTLCHRFYTYPFMRYQVLLLSSLRKCPIYSLISKRVAATLIARFKSEWYNLGIVQPRNGNWPEKVRNNIKSIASIFTNPGVSGVNHISVINTHLYRFPHAITFD